jgi:hypothetical protein
MSLSLRRSGHWQTIAMDIFRRSINRGREKLKHTKQSFKKIPGWGVSAVDSLDGSSRGDVRSTNPPFRRWSLAD